MENSGSTNTSSQAPAAGGLFGKATMSQPTGGLFGQAQTTQPQTTQGSGLFGASTQPAQTGGLFGAAPAAQQSGGLFGGAPASTQPQSSGLFGGAQAAQTPASTGGMFGSAQAQQPQQTGGGLFGDANAQNQNLPKPSFLYVLSAPNQTSCSKLIYPVGPHRCNCPSLSNSSRRARYSRPLPGHNSRLAPLGAASPAASQWASRKPNLPKQLSPECA